MAPRQLLLELEEVEMAADKAAPHASKSRPAPPRLPRPLTSLRSASGRRLRWRLRAPAEWPGPES
eukprot:scaffold2643_cov117-Isochrysis_galbana.AAC.8